MFNFENRDSLVGVIAKNKRKILVGLGLVASAATVAGVVKYGPSDWGSLLGDGDFWLGHSDIVGGVTGQVEGRLYQNAYDDDGVFSGYNFYLLVEQCPQDVVAAKRHEATTSFNPAVGQIADGCNYDYVMVPYDVYNQMQDGATIIFTGEPGSALPG